MQLYLYDYESGENIFSWRPIEDQWWITGFAPDKTYNGIENQVMIGSVQFPNGEMYEAVVDGIEKLKKSQSGKEQFFILDETNHTIWIMWYEESLI